MNGPSSRFAGGRVKLPESGPNPPPFAPWHAAQWRAYSAVASCPELDSAGFQREAVLHQIRHGFDAGFLEIAHQVLATAIVEKMRVGRHRAVREKARADR